MSVQLQKLFQFADKNGTIGHLGIIVTFQLEKRH